MSWDIFRRNILRYVSRPETIVDINVLARLWAREYDAAIKRGGDTVNGVPLIAGNTTALENSIRLTLERGLISSGGYDLVGNMGTGILSYWTGATMNQIPVPIIPAVGSTSNISVVSNNVTNVGTWRPIVRGIDETIGTTPNTISAVYESVQIAGSGILNDEEGVEFDEETLILSTIVPSDQPSASIRNTPESVDVVPSSNYTPPSSCTIRLTDFIDYTIPLTANFKLEDLTLNPIWPHRLRSQRGRSVNEIVCNLQHLARNVLEPIRSRYPNMFITSGFRRSSNSSQHTIGEAVDIQFRGYTPRQCLDVAMWFIQNHAFDQFIFEHGNNIWFHISIKLNGDLRREVKTMRKVNGIPRYEPGLKLYYR